MTYHLNGEWLTDGSQRMPENMSQGRRCGAQQEDQMSDINIEKLRLFVGALRQVVENEPAAQVVKMDSVYMPECGMPGCHAGLAYLALNLLGFQRSVCEYNFWSEKGRLASYLEVDSGLPSWAEEHPEEWGNIDGRYMFSSPNAFGMDKNRFPSSVIADHWAGVLARLENKP